MQPVSEKRQFHIRSCLGRGGFGEVYRAVMMSAGGVRSDVAVKVLHQELDPRSQAVERLRDEARLLGILNHPNILKVSDLVLLEERVALVTEYVEGADLDQCIESTEDPIPMRPLVEVIGRVADALHAAHFSPGADGEPLYLVHRDIKPSNIRISRHGSVKLLDFGIAKATDAKREAKTQTNALIGSFLYMAPERFEEGASTPAADVYSLGVSLYEGLTNKQLFADLSVKQQYFLAFDRNKHDEALEARFAEMGEVPPPVVELLRHLLQFEVADRPEPAKLATLCDDLAEDMAGPSLRKWCRSHPWPDPEAMSGPLDGKVITETAFTMTQTRQQVMAGSPPQTTWMATPPPAPTATAPPAAGPSQTAAPSYVAPPQSIPPAQPSQEGGGGAKAGLVALGAFGFFGVVALAALGLIAVLALNPGSSAPAEVVAEAPDEGEPEVDTATPAPKPAPAPVVAVAPVPEPQPEPQPVVKPTKPRPVVKPTKPTPTPEPAAATARITVSGAVAELRDRRGAHSPGTVSPGTYELWVRFGERFSRKDVVTVRSGDSITFKCSKLKQTCSKQ